MQMKRFSEMSPEEKRVAVAELCGWVPVDCSCGCGAIAWRKDDLFASDSDDLPNYLNDLNACYYMEETLREPLWSDYVANMWDFLGLKRSSKFWTSENLMLFASCIHANEQVRVDAFLITKGYLP